MGAGNSKKWYRIYIFLLINSIFYSYLLTEKDARSLHTSPTFGRTHFIRGFPQDALPNSIKPLKKTHNAPTVLRVLFAPDDNLQKEIIQLICAEQKSIKIAIYLFTNKKIAEALLNAHDRGVRIELIVDGANANIKYSKIDLLQKKNGIFICKYQAKPGFNGQLDSIMHNKFVIFECNKNGNSLVWTGSYNFTVRATRKNQENAIISDDLLLVEHFEKQFERLKKRCC